MFGGFTETNLGLGSELLPGAGRNHTVRVVVFSCNNVSDSITFTLMVVFSLAVCTEACAIAPSSTQTSPPATADHISNCTQLGYREIRSTQHTA